MKRIQTKNEVAVIRRSGWFLLCTYALLFLLFASGCNNKFFDPTQIGRFRPVPAVNVILDTLGVAEETSVAWEQAEDPKPEDTIAVESDYVFRSGDVVRISILELLQEGALFTNDYVVTETGKISIPEVGVIEAAGLTETQLEEQIRQILAPSVLKEPSVVATLVASQQRAFSILGDGVATPSRYVIPRYDYRLADALATAGGVRQFNVSYIYVSRYAEKEQAAVGAPKRPRPQELEELELLRPEELTEPQLIEPQKLTEPEKDAWEVITPRAQRQWPQSRVVVTTSEMITDRELAQAGSPGDFGILSDGQRDWGSVRSKPVEPTTTETTTPEPEEEAIKNEPVSVKDILKTLSERSGRGRTTGAQTSAGRMVREPTAEPSAPQPMVELPTGEEIGVEETPALPEMPRREKINQRAGVRKTVRPSAGVSPTGREETVEEVAQPSLGPTGQETTGGEADIDAVLRSLSERQRPQAGVGAKEAVAPLEEEPVGQERMEERINVDEVLKTLSERPRRERIGPPVGEAVGVEAAPEVPRRRIITEEGVPAPSAKPVAPEKKAEEEAGRIEWIFQDGKWVPVQVGPPKPVAPVIGFERGEELVSPLEERAKPVPEFERREGAKSAKSRLIRIPADKLLAGDPRYNIVIKPGDTIHVPVDIIGEFCIMGNVNNQGYVNTTGRPMTLKMAVAAAGGLGPLAWPKTCEVVRRIGKKKEEIVLVNLDKIASGEQPDFFIKPNDLINVGTHPTSIWRLRLRNAFTATYGFWLVYDRNFADIDAYHRGLTTWFD
jgi:protein involved in polysaccharide export with SLBB domain